MNLNQSSRYFGTVIWPIVGKSVYQQTLTMFVTHFAENTRNAHGHGENFWVSTHFLSLSLLSSLYDFFVSLSGAQMSLLVIAAKTT